MQAPPDPTSTGHLSTDIQAATDTPELNTYHQDMALTPYEPDTAGKIQIVAGVVLALAGVLLAPGLGAVVGIVLIAGLINAVAPIWSSPTTAEESWGPISNYAASMMDKKIEEFVIHNASLHGATLFSSIRTMQENLKLWLDSDKQQGKQLLLNSIYFLLNQYPAQMIFLTQAQYRGTLIGQYCTAAFGLLGALAGIYPYADELGILSRSTISGKEFIAERIRSCIEEFIEQAIESYRFGLQSIITSAKTNSSITWIQYNEYRNTATRTALDLLPKFVFFRPDLYAEPGRISTSLLNRQLLTLVETDVDARGTLNVHQIEEYEKAVNTPQPIEQLAEITHGYTYVPFHKPLTIFDGLGFIECKTITTDGFDAYFNSTLTGWDNLPYMQYRTLDLRNSTIETVSGKYWKTPNGSLLDPSLIGTICEMAYTTPLHAYLLHFLSDKFYEPYTYPQNPFSHDFISAPQNGSAKKHADEVLASIEVVPDQHEYAFAYIFRWLHHSIGRDMLPVRGHSPTSGIQYIESFYAVRASYSIRTQGLQIVAGPGFTGGDLVSLPPIGTITFQMERDPARWFAGFYKVRLWYFPTIENGEYTDVPVELRTSSPEAISNSVTATAKVAASWPNDTKNLHFKDYGHLDFAAPILLSPLMSSITLSLRQHSLIEYILIDRIELIFDSPATQA